MSSGLSQQERRFLNYQGLPACEISRIERVSIDQVLAIWDSLKERGVVVSHAHAGPAQEQLSFDCIDRLMRGNRGPVEPPNAELGWTTTDLEGSW